MPVCLKNRINARLLDVHELILPNSFNYSIVFSMLWLFEWTLSRLSFNIHHYSCLGFATEIGGKTDITYLSNAEAVKGDRYRRGAAHQHEHNTLGSPSHIQQVADINWPTIESTQARSSHP